MIWWKSQLRVLPKCVDVAVICKTPIDHMLVCGTFGGFCVWCWTCDKYIGPVWIDLDPVSLVKGRSGFQNSLCFKACSFVYIM